MPRLTIDAEGYTPACPECDKAGSIWERVDQQVLRYSAGRFRCERCCAEFDFAIIRRYKDATSTRGAAHNMSAVGDALLEMDPDTDISEIASGEVSVQ